jgi:hypothetical protein
VKKTTFLVRNREAVGNNAARVLNIDGGALGRIYACIDEAAQDEITHQLAKRVDTSNEIVPEREGYTVDVVTFNATLRELFTAETLPFDHDAQIEAWALELESLAKHLREYKARRQQEASSIFCRRCLHSLLDHEQPDSGELGCSQQNCYCLQFYPITSQSLKGIIGGRSQFSEGKPSVRSGAGGRASPPSERSPNHPRGS